MKVRKNAERGSHGILKVLSQQWASLTEKIMKNIGPDNSTTEFLIGYLQHVTQI